jgi:hypothetical protein
VGFLAGEAECLDWEVSPTLCPGSEVGNASSISEPHVRIDMTDSVPCKVKCRLQALNTLDCPVLTAVGEGNENIYQKLKPLGRGHGSRRGFSLDMAGLSRVGAPV